MGVLYLFYFMNAITIVYLQTCSKFAVNEVTQMSKKLENHKISCLHKLTLGECALECLLVKRCKSFNHLIEYNLVCELNALTHYDARDWDMVNSTGYVYVDIREWPKEVAGTCASNPCSANQRCVPVTPPRCFDIDCGIPPVVHRNDVDTSMYYYPGTTSVGSEARYICHDSEKAVSKIRGYTTFDCIPGAFRLCNSNSQWSSNGLFCM